MDSEISYSFLLQTESSVHFHKKNEEEERTSDEEVESDNDHLTRRSGVL